MGGQQPYNQQHQQQHWQNEMERRRLIDSNGQAEFSALHRSTIDFALGSIRGAMLLNGGGAVAVLSFMATSQAARSADLLTTLKLFVFGALISCLTYGVSYVGQTFFTAESGYRWAHQVDNSQGKDKVATRYRIAAVLLQVIGSIMIVVALVLFAWACFSAHDALQNLNTVKGCPWAKPY